MTEIEFLRQMVSALTKQNAELLNQVAVLTERIDELLEQLDKKQQEQPQQLQAAVQRRLQQACPKEFEKAEREKTLRGGIRGYHELHQNDIQTRRRILRRNQGCVH